MTTLADVLDAHRTHRHDNGVDLWHYCTCGDGVRYYDRSKHSQHVVEAVVAAGLAVIQLPEPMADRSNVAESLRDKPMWEVDGSWTCLTAADCIEFEAAHQTEYGSVTLAEGRSLAAALLAAAAAAEAVTA